MKKYGLRIGEIGIEFSSIEERDKALKDFTRGVDVKIHSIGIRYTDGEGTFSVYDRDTKEILVTCSECIGIFGIDSCGKRTYPYKNSWEKEYLDKVDYICDACLAKQIKLKEVFDAKKVINEIEDSD
jgi:hypothetical protein